MLGAVLCRHARELRARLNQTAQVRAQLVSAVDALQRTARQEDATGVRQAIDAGQSCGGGLLDDVASAQQALQRWQLATDNEAKLAKALTDGTSVLSLSRAVQVCFACVHDAWAHDGHRQASCFLHVEAKDVSGSVTAWRCADSCWCCSLHERKCPPAWLDVRLNGGVMHLLRLALIEAVQVEVSCAKTGS